MDRHPVGDADLDQGGDLARRGIGREHVQITAKMDLGGRRLILDLGRVDFI
jgi:hypothetical protein